MNEDHLNNDTNDSSTQKAGCKEFLLLIMFLLSGMYIFWLGLPIQTVSKNLHWQKYKTECCHLNMSYSFKDLCLMEDKCYGYLLQWLKYERNISVKTIQSRLSKCCYFVVPYSPHPIKYVLFYFYGNNYCHVECLLNIL